MILKPLSDEELGCTSYIIGDEFTGQCAIIDPLHSIGSDRYAIECQRESITISGVFDTHTHADHLSEALAISDKFKVPRYLSATSGVSSKFVPVSGGDSVKIGSVEIKVLDLPGHTRDSIGLICSDTMRGSDPQLVFTGDTLMAGDVGRPDLADSDEETDDLCRLLFNSLRTLMSLPDFVEVYPAHFGSSHCGSIFLSRKKWTTIGYERRFNRFIRASTWESLKKDFLKYRTKPPENAKIIIQENMR
ncbi:MAG: MBL fold metallo-hydrolase [Thermoplasmataceae archaeon]